MTSLFNFSNDLDFQITDRAFLGQPKAASNFEIIKKRKEICVQKEEYLSVQRSSEKEYILIRNSFNNTEKGLDLYIKLKEYYYILRHNHVLVACMSRDLRLARVSVVGEYIFILPDVV
jgi:hypothetical protein